jgi:hypothetical protein
MDKKRETEENMRMTYNITGVLEEGDRIRLTITPTEPVQEKQSMTKILSDPMAYVESMKIDAIRKGRPESISIPKDYWEEYKWNIGDIISVAVLPL